jgi:tetratricopeptide (TPR) repeat protein
MNPAEEQKLRYAAQLLKAGEKAQAQTLFSQALAENPTLADAWVGLALCAEAVETRKKCLRRALALNPNYTYARTSLERLEKEAPAAIPVTAAPAAAAEAAPKPSSAPKNPGWSEKQVAWAILGIVLTAVCLLTGLVAFVSRPAVVQLAEATGRPRFIEFYADW